MCVPSYNHGMKNSLAASLAIVLALGACGRGPDEGASASNATATPEKSEPVPYDPAFKDISGTWVSSADAVGQGRILRVDVASGGGYSIDVRMPGTPEQILETGRGEARIDGGAVVASPSDQNAGTVLGGLGAWRATLANGRSMELTGADGRKVRLAYVGS